MKRILFSLALIASPALALGTKAPNPATTPVPAADWTAFLNEHNRLMELAVKTTPAPNTRPIVIEYDKARLARQVTNYSEFGADRELWLTAAKAMCVESPLMNCGTVNPYPAPAR